MVSETAKCLCCGEREAHPLCDGLCVECESSTFCERCDCLLENEGWEPGEEREQFCESCHNKNDTEEWIEQTKETVMQLAAKHGWDFDRFGWSGGFNTRSEYIELTRRCAFCGGGDEDGECECETLTVRVSDHGSAYCREDISLALNPNGDDHSLGHLERVLERRN